MHVFWTCDIDFQVSKKRCDGVCVLIRFSVLFIGVFQKSFLFLSLFCCCIKSFKNSPILNGIPLVHFYFPLFHSLHTHTQNQKKARKKKNKNLETVLHSVRSRLCYIYMDVCMSSVCMCVVFIFIFCFSLDSKLCI